MWALTEITECVCESELQLLTGEHHPWAVLGTKFTGIGTRSVELF